MKKESGFSVLFILLIGAIIGLAGYLLYLWGCSIDLCGRRVMFPDDISPNTSTSRDWQIVEAERFSIKLPKGWKFNKTQGIDSYTGEFLGDGIIISFDYGMYSNDLSHRIRSSDTFYKTIDGRKAFFVVPPSNSGIIGVYFENVTNARTTPTVNDSIGTIGSPTKLTLYAKDISKDKQVIILEAFKTIRFQE